VLVALARVVSDAASLKEVVARLAETLRDSIPFQRMHLLRLDRAHSVGLFTVRSSGELDVTEHRIPDMSEADGLRPGPSIEPHAKSVLICPLRQGARVLGVLWFASDEPDVFGASHNTLLESVADLITLGVQHDAIRTTEAVRRERLDSLERLLQAMAGALDIRNIFNEVSDVVRAALPHDTLALTSWANDGRSFRVYAVAGERVTDPQFWEPVPLAQTDQALLNRDAYILRDTSTDVDAESVRGKLFRRFGAQSALRVAIPIPLAKGVFGSLFFLARDVDAFEEDDVDFGRRVASHLAVALSHEQLAEAARRDAAARETAARLEAQVATLKRELEARGGQRRVIGSSPRWNDVLAHAARVARTETTVLLTGESGTGKEVVARFIHHASRRGTGPFIAINCAALPDHLLETELFGHERGAFTGAVAAKPGRIEQAGGGVLFLDEIGEMPTPLQAKLLRVLEEREFIRLGGTRLLKADIRVIAATNRDLKAAIARGDFREDLYYRLGVFEIALPPLRERPEDILELATDFLTEIGQP
jgi:transcriptional regulator with GAF, ATPase, and Fis domain